jgi:hypothetical protein
MIIEIDKSITLDQLDSCYDRLARASEVDALVDLLLPIKLENHFGGLVPALFQVVITWSRYKNAGRLLLNIQNPGQADFNEILENELLFPSIILVWFKCDIYNSTGEIDLRSYLKDPLGDIRNLMMKVRPMKGNKLLLVSIDHFPFVSGGLPMFETPDSFIDNEASTMRNLKPALESILSFSKEVKKEFALYGMDFIKIIHELFKNTYEWARTDYNNIALNPSIRGTLVKFFKKRRQSILQEYKWHTGLRHYFESEVHVENHQEELYFVELSVFDSGAGFVEKFESPDKSEISDIDIIKRCLMLHMTSAKGLEKDVKGVGLDKILQILSNKGLIRIINSLRNSDKPDSQLKQAVYVRNLLDPHNFSRFNDGVIQASILRSASADELAYSIDNLSSQEMYNTLETMIAYYDQEQGEALLEFLYALAIKKLTLARSHLVDVLSLIKAKCKEEIFECFGSYIQEYSIDEPERLRSEPFIQKKSSIA